MPNPAYQAPVAKLLFQGCPDSLNSNEKVDYLQAFGFGEEHISELSRLATEENLNWDDEEEGYAPIHACRALGQLKTETAIQALLPLFDSNYDWLREDLPSILAEIGPVCIPILTKYLSQVKNPWLGISTAAGGLTKIALTFPEHRQKCTDILTAALARHKQRSPKANGSIVYQLLDLKAVDAASVIEKAYKEGPMDEMICGSLARVQIELGLASVEDFSPEELLHREPEWMKNFREMLDISTGHRFDSMDVQSVGQQGLFIKPQTSLKKANGFGTAQPKRKKRKKRKKKR